MPVRWSVQCGTARGHYVKHFQSEGDARRYYRNLVNVSWAELVNPDGEVVASK